MIIPHNGKAALFIGRLQHFGELPKLPDYIDALRYTDERPPDRTDMECDAEVYRISTRIFFS